MRKIIYSPLMKIKFLILAALSTLFISCASQPSWETFNPLDVPQSHSPTVAELHSENVSAITGNPTINRLNEPN